jgi:hypothetical protein
VVARPDGHAGAAASEALTVSRRAAFLIGAGALLGVAGLLAHHHRGRPAGRALEIQLRTSAGDFAQLSWGASSGFHVERQPLARTPDGFQSLRFPLPVEALESVRLTPVDRPGEVEVAQLRVLEADGSLVRELSVRSSLHPESQIASMEREGRRVRIVTDPGATAPTLRVTPACLAEPSTWYSLASVTPLSLALGACAFVALLLASIVVLAAGSHVRAAGPANTRWTPAMWLALLFLLIVSAKLLLLHVYPARVPYLDQWDAEAAGVYIPFDEGCLSWGQMVSFHNEHRVFFTRLLALTLLAANGRWDPQLQQVVNAGLHALTALALALMFWRAADGRRLNLVVVFCAVLFTLPFGWENTLAGFQSSFYVLLLFSVLSLALTVRRVRSAAWVLGWLCAISSLVTTAGGLFTPVAIGIAAVLRLVTRQTTWREAVVNLGMSAAVFALGLSLVSPAIGLSAALAPQSPGEFAAALTGNLAWPWVDIRSMAVIAWLPVLSLGTVMVWRRRATDQEVLMVALGAWVLVQAAGLAFARGVGGAAAASRYMDILSLGVLANAMALIALSERVREYRPNLRFGTAILAAWSLCAIVGSARSGAIALEGAAERRAWMITYEQTLQSFLKDDDIAALSVKAFPQVVPHWNPRMLGNAWLRHPYIREILPPAVREPSSIDPRSGDTIEAPWGSRVAASLIDSAWLCLFAALGLTLLAAFFDPAPLSR